MADPFETRPAAEAAAASEPPIREFADRGTLWLLESPENLRGLVQLVARDVADRLDFSRAQRVNRSFIPDDLHKQEADLLFLVPLREGRGEVWVYVLLEHQSRPDRTMGLRLLSYIVQLWEMQRRGFQDERIPMSRWRLHPVLPIVFYTGKRRWSSPISVAALMDVPPLLERFVPRFDTLFLNLQETSPDVLTQAESAIALALRALQASDQPRETLAEVLEEVVIRLEALPESAQAELRRALEYLFLLVHHRRDPEEQDELSEIMVSSVERLREEAENMAMTSAQVLIGRGRREGRAEGRQEGRQEMLMEILLEQLEFRFGPLPEEIQERLKGMPQRQLRTLAVKAITAESLSELGLTPERGA